MSIFLDHIDAMTPYSPPLEGRDPTRYTLLDFNERTIPVAEVIARDIADWVLSGRLQMYPSYGDAVALVAAHCGVPESTLMLTNGSDQGLDLVFRASCQEGDEVIIPEPSFPIYAQSARIENTRIHAPNYTREGGYPFEEVKALVNERTRVIVVANPNNPSGTAVAAEDIVALASAAPKCIVLVDECYFEYSGITVADRVSEQSNIIVTRTFSKTWGLPSLRLGYLIAAADNVEALLKVRGPYDVNQLAVVALRSALKHKALVAAYCDEVMSRSKPAFEAWLTARRVPFWPSAANFIWAFFDEPEAIAAHLQQAGILVRPKRDAAGQMGLRVTLGTEEQTRTLISVLDGWFDR